ncbi:MAG: L-histidine N(alpha)-methyltransferase [Planctomycetes bacterium]|nr:L-histidine N(alpha)-methyltransferase [Planctomycetota bacterium]
MSDEILEDKLKRYLDRRQLPDAFLYIGERGATNWLALEASTRFPVASALTALLQEHVDSLARQATHYRSVVSIGAGDGQKELILLRELRRYGRPICHIIDISRPMVESARRTLGKLDIETRGMTAFCEDLDQLAPHWDRPTLLCLLGNNFSNYDPDFLLNLIGRNLGPADAFLLDASLRPEKEQDIPAWVQEVEAIYNSPENARFNVSPLVTRGMDPESCRFELKLIRVPQPWGEVWRTHKRIRVLRPALVRCGAATVAFAAGDAIEMGFTYKYRLAQLQDCLQQRGFGLRDTRLDSTGGNVILLAARNTTETTG